MTAGIHRASSILMTILFGLVVTVAGCSTSHPEDADPAAESPPADAAQASPEGGVPGAGQDDPLPLADFETALPASLRDLVARPFKGDFDELVKRRLIRVGVAYNRTHYFVDRGVQRGLTFEYIKQFEDTINARLRTGNLRVHVVLVPLSQDRLIPALTNGHVDAVAAQLTITPERQRLVRFSVPLRRNVSEVVVTGPDTPALTSADDLSGRDVFVRRSSSYYESLMSLNARLEAAGLAPVSVLEAPENLEDDDLLEMVSAGLVPATVADDYIAEFWTGIFTGLKVHPSATLRTDGELAVAFRVENPALATETNAFIKTHGIGTLFGNTVTRRYLQSTQFARRATSGNDRQKFLKLTELFRRYGDRYDIDYLLMMAKGYQESRLDQRARSRVGAIGIMQIMPATGRAMAVGDIHQVGPNVHAGVKYNRMLMDKYLGNEPLDDLNKGFFTLASYNAGPTRIRQLRREAERRGLDPNVWFGQVERVVSERIGRETVSYVSNIYKYYIAYRLVTEEQARRAAAKVRVEPGR